MSRRPRRSHSAVFEAKVALNAIHVDKTLAEMVKLHDVHSNQITDWKVQLLERGQRVWRRGAGRVQDRHKGVALQDRAAGAGDRSSVRCAHQSGTIERNAMIDRTHELPVKRQAGCWASAAPACTTCPSR
jgi:transposase-like protein